MRQTAISRRRSLPWHPQQLWRCRPRAVAPSRLHSVLAKPSISPTASLSRANLIAAQQLCQVVPLSSVTLPQSGLGHGDPAGQRSRVPCDGTPRSPRQVWEPLTALRLLLSAPGESLVIPQHTSAKDESVFYTLVFGLSSN